MNEKLEIASITLENLSNDMWQMYKSVEKKLREILAPCGMEGCLVGTEDYADDIYYVYGQPTPNEHLRVTKVRYNPDTEEIEVLFGVGDYPGARWLDLRSAHIDDLQFLVEEIANNLEYSDGYQENDDDKYLINQYGQPYDENNSLPAGGGLDKRCDYNADALYAFNCIKGDDEIVAYLTKRGFVPGVQGMDYVEWFKGNTKIVYEHYNRSQGLYCYMYTEFVKDNEPEEEEKEYDVPFLRTQWADVRVKAVDEADALKKAEAIFQEGKDGWVDWEDVDKPQFDKEHGVQPAP